MVEWGGPQFNITHVLKRRAQAEGHVTKAEVGRRVHQPRIAQDCQRHSSEGTGLGQPRPERPGGAALRPATL